VVQQAGEGFLPWLTGSCVHQCAMHAWPSAAFDVKQLKGLLGHASLCKQGQPHASSAYRKVNRVRNEFFAHNRVCRAGWRPCQKAALMLMEH
jgi:hypothetical protein